MPRQRSAGPSRAPARPTVPSRTSSVPQQQTRPATTYAAPSSAPRGQAGPPAAAPTATAAPASAGSGLFGQMATTAAGVAVGHTVANGIMGMFGGGSSSEPAQAAASDNAVASQGQQGSYYANQSADPNCALATKSFTNCMDEHQGNMSICGWYMDQLKACQQAASRY
ncbi:hypothetical protein BD289DRAFT_276644 [Coniella lustricola]|uniref:CHCH domain-containing protein n=1 Tax=Coniella lustricola TaxID=2025994 RepID=A0A2T3A6N1_9PEZI|nr:hypothetical protein BD289DRAFT_276644 [Coniella lustricola]